MVDGDGIAIIVTVVVIAQSRARKRQESWWALLVARVPASSAKYQASAAGLVQGLEERGHYKTT